MITFKTLSLKNFLSYGAVPTVVNLERPGTTLINGEDLDNTSSGVGGNGVGKTSILNALTYAVYDKPISNISKDNLVNNINKKNMVVSLEFSKDDNHYKIIRARKTKAGAAGNWVQFFEMQADSTYKEMAPASMSNTNALIENIIGIPFDLFVRIIAISATHVPFLDLPVRHPTSANQTDIIEELFDLKTLSEKATILKEQTKEIEASLEISTIKTDSIKREHARHNRLIESTTVRVDAWDTANKQEITKLEHKITELQQLDVDGQRSLIEQADVIKQQIAELKQHQMKLESELTKAVKVKSSASAELKHLLDDKCPYCLQSMTDTDTKIHNCNEKVDISDVIIETISEKLEQLYYDQDTHNNDLKLIRNEIVVDDINNLFDTKSKLEGYEKHLAAERRAVNPHNETLAELNDTELDTIDMDHINNLREDIDHRKFLLKILTKKDSFVRKALLNKNIPFLNKRLSTYLTMLGLPHSVEFSHEMTANITQFGQLMDFGNLSNGQRARVNLALSFSFRDVLQRIHSRVNVCMLDEILDVGLDDIGVTLAAKMLKTKARDENISMYIISHKQEIDSAFDNTLTIQLSKRFSFIKEEQIT